MNKKKIIGFDGWTGGARHYARFVDHRDYPGEGFKLIHLGSWGAEPKVRPYEKVSGVECFDISCFGTSDFFEIMRKEAPDCVVFLSTHVFDHRGMIKVCQSLGIKTLHIFPGVLGVLAVNRPNAYKFSISSHVLNLWSRLPKLVLHTLPSYASVLYRTKSGTKAWWDFFLDLLAGACRRNRRQYCDGSAADRCLVYLGSERAIAVNKYGYDAGNVKVIGLPDVKDFGVTRDDVMSQFNSVGGRGKAVYFDTGYLYTGDLFRGAGEYVDHIASLRDYLQDFGLQLIFKPKPQKGNKLKDALVSELQERHIEVYEGNDIVGLLKQCDFSLTEPSTIGLIPALMGMPVCMVGFGAFKGQTYGECISECPNSIMITDVSQLSSVTNVCTKSELESWVNSIFDGDPVKDVPALINKELSDLVSR